MSDRIRKDDNDVFSDYDEGRGERRRLKMPPPKRHREDHGKGRRSCSFSPDEESEFAFRHADKKQREINIKVDQMIRGVEDLEATIARPSGKDLLYIHQCDNDFSHYMTDADKSLKEKIKKGEFVELEKTITKT